MGTKIILRVTGILYKLVTLKYFKRRFRYAEESC